MKTVIAALLVVIAGVAQANETSCSVWSSAISRALFSNSGVFATSGPALLIVPECEAKTGTYGNLFFVVPLRDFDRGKEVDVRVGKRSTVGGVKMDASVSYWYFGIGPGPMQRTWNSTLRLSRPFSGKDITLTPYFVADWQYNENVRDDALRLGAGTQASMPIGILPGKPTLSADASAWKYVSSLAPGKGPVGALGVSLDYRVNAKVTAGPRAMWTWGDVVVPGDHRPKHMFGVFVFALL